MPRKSSNEKRIHIRHSAYVCFRENGYYQTSIDDICEAANISKGSFYWHYGAKLDVFIEILETWAREVVDELLEQFERATRSPDRMGQLAVAFEREFHRARAIVPLWVEFSLLGRKDPEIQMSIGKFFRRARAAISEILRQSIRGHLSEQEIRASSSVILGAFMGLTLQEFADSNTNAANWARDFMSVLSTIFNSGSNPMTPGSRASDERLSSIIGDCSVAQRHLFRSTRELILGRHPQLDERWIQGWRVLGYSTERLILHLKTKDSGVELTFYEGASLSDPSSLLTGSGKKRRSFFINNPDKVEIVSNFIDESLSHSS